MHHQRQTEGEEDRHCTSHCRACRVSARRGGGISRYRCSYRSSHSHSHSLSHLASCDSFSRRMASVRLAELSRSASPSMMNAVCFSPRWFAVAKAEQEVISGRCLESAVPRDGSGKILPRRRFPLEQAAALLALRGGRVSLQRQLFVAEVDALLTQGRTPDLLLLRCLLSDRDHPFCTWRLFAVEVTAMTNAARDADLGVPPRPHFAVEAAGVCAQRENRDVAVPRRPLSVAEAAGVTSSARDAGLFACWRQCAVEAAEEVRGCSCRVALPNFEVPRWRCLVGFPQLRRALSLHFGFRHSEISLELHRDLLLEVAEAILHCTALDFLERYLRQDSSSRSNPSRNLARRIRVGRSLFALERRARRCFRGFRIAMVPIHTKMARH